jgi:hypothetical protein
LRGIKSPLAAERWGIGVNTLKIEKMGKCLYGYALDTQEGIPQGLKPIL